MKKSCFFINNLLFLIAFSVHPSVQASTKKKGGRLLGQFFYHELTTNKSIDNLTSQKLGPVNQICFYKPGGAIPLYEQTSTTRILAQCDRMSSSLDEYGVTLQHITPLFSSNNWFINTGAGSTYVPLDENGSWQLNTDPFFDKTNQVAWLPRSSVSLNYKWSNQFDTSIGWQKIYNSNHQEHVDFLPIKAAFLF